jgi:transposase
MLRRELVSAFNALWLLIYLRRVNHTNHASLTMSNLAAVEPDRICIINSQRPDRLKGQKVIHPDMMLMELPFRY